MKEIEKFKELINQKEFYKAHESLEELWFPIRKNKDDYSLILKGFINASVSMELYKREKKVQSKKIYLVYKKYVSYKRLDKLDNSLVFRELKQFIDIKFNDINIA